MLLYKDKNMIKACIKKFSYYKSKFKNMKIRTLNKKENWKDLRLMQLNY